MENIDRRPGWPFPFPFLTALNLALLSVLVGRPPVSLAGEGKPAGVRSLYFQSSDGVRLHYLEAGKGRTLVFIPGWTMPAEIWEPQILYFSRSHRVVAFDPRSQGDSAVARAGHNPKRRARDISELFDQLGSGPVALIGWSLGVLEVLSYVKFHGEERLAAIVLVDNSVGENPPPKSSGFLSRLKKDREGTIRNFVRKMYKTPQSEAYYARITRRSLKTPYAASVSLLTSLFPRSIWRKAVYSVEAPLLYVVTSRFAGQAANLKRNKPGVWTEVFPAAGHALFVDEPERFNRLVSKFLQRRVWKSF